MTIATLGCSAVLVVLVFWSIDTVRQVLATWGELYDDFGVIRYGVRDELRRAVLVLSMKLLVVAIVSYVNLSLLL